MSTRMKWKRHALGARPAQRRQPVADLLEGNAEAALQDLDVVAGRLGRVAEQLVGHQHRGGEIVGERRAHQRVRLLAREAAFADDAVEHVVIAEIGDLVRDLEDAARRRQHLGDFEAARQPVVARGSGPAWLGAADLDGDRIAVAQQVGQALMQGVDGQAVLRPQPLRRLLQLGEIVHAALDEVGHLLRGDGDRRGPVGGVVAGAAGLVERAVAPLGIVDVEHGAADRRAASPPAPARRWP